MFILFFEIKRDNGVYGTKKEQESNDGLYLMRTRKIAY